MKLLVPLFMVLLVGLGCSSDKDSENPVITLSTPILGQVFHGGDPIYIKGSVTDDKYLLELIIRVTDAITGTVIIEFISSPEAAATNFDQLMGAAVAGIHYRLQVIAKDKAKNDSRIVIEFTCI